MSAPPPTTPPAGSTGWANATESRIDRLTAYLVEHGDRFTPEALRAAAADAGYTPDEIETAEDLVATRRRVAEAARPLRMRARLIVLAAYSLVYAVLAWALLSAPNLDYLGTGEAALVVLTIVLGIALLISIAWVNRRGRTPARLEGALLAMLVAPLILLGGVAGLCVVTTRPFGVV
jgi:hypothetical protein